ncbi:conserved hypothetical protein [Perkinsus marinus ATCC 50983]|uniref:Nuclease S1 n=1 Tax=Perkinsus marinus (strain ATCC 50983 / TXsc) TaxID=423536 RepID=C5K481_PERM5|nr:conserved hypothetical protein [Perkinsus marinus ATCC 50983]EER20697.1 conserved hypothetical protein [Perkinsus marinus ATCC 50983]|eukprot:XP_002788901.1 conserved hypothetical protein [Perkinsus marinus ATCC 50983]
MVSSFVVLASVLPLAAAWGLDGHGVVATIAGFRLTPEAREAHDAIMGKGVRLADYASWPDYAAFEGPEEVTSVWGWSGAIHHADTQGCHFIYSRDCKDDMCVAGGLKNYTQRVVDESLPLSERQTAMKFVVHLMADIHQPLHGGNLSDSTGIYTNVQIEFANFVTTNLHFVWDFSLLDQWEMDRYAGDYIMQREDVPQRDRTRFWSTLVASIGEKLQKGGEYADQVDSWLADCEHDFDQCLNDMVDTDAQLSCQLAYTNVDGTPVVNGSVLPREYYDTRIATVEEQIAKGGVRLAWLLNTILPASPSTTTMRPTEVTTTTIAPGYCSKADEMCASKTPGSYCKYWLDIPTCFGSNEPCSC